MTHTTRRGLAVVSALALCAGLAACGSDDSQSEESEAGPTSTFTATAAPTTHPAGAGARADLTGSTCEADDGAWSFRGVLTNPGETAVTYTVTVSVAEIDGVNVKGSTEIVETVEPSEEKEIEAASFFTDPSGGLRCAISVHRR